MSLPLCILCKYLSACPSLGQCPSFGLLWHLPLRHPNTLLLYQLPILHALIHSALVTAKSLQPQNSAKGREGFKVC